MPPDDLAKRIRSTISNTSREIWFPQLTHELAGAGWARLQATLGIGKYNYSTVAVHERNCNRAPVIPFELCLESPRSVQIELLPPQVTSPYVSEHISFYTASELNETNRSIRNCLQDAFHLIRTVPSLFNTVSQLVRSIHLIRTRSDEYDVSFSEPRFPFSIFVSIPTSATRLKALRVAEGIVHEAMHSQLTLINEIGRLTGAEGEYLYSPWRDEPRPVYGVLHGSYVFSVLREYYRGVLKQENLADGHEFANERIDVITSQLNEVSSLQANPALTALGHSLATRIGSPRETPPKSP
jgi:HEXXH motif-containing protein